MAAFKVTTPVPGYSGSVGGVTFANGQAVIDDEAHAAELGYFLRSGYTVGEVEPDELVPVDVDNDGTVDELPKRSASTEVWRAFAVEHGMPEVEAEGLTRDQLVELYTKESNS